MNKWNKSIPMVGLKLEDLPNIQWQEKRKERSGQPCEIPDIFSGCSPSNSTTNHSSLRTNLEKKKILCPPCAWCKLMNHAAYQ